MTQDEFNQVSWAAFMKWAVSDRDMNLAFQAASGREFNDSAQYVVQFVEWATLNHFGLEHAPQKYRESLEAKKANAQ